MKFNYTVKGCQLAVLILAVAAQMSIAIAQQGPPPPAIETSMSVKDALSAIATFHAQTSEESGFRLSPKGFIEDFGTGYHFEYFFRSMPYLQANCSKKLCRIGFLNGAHDSYGHNELPRSRFSDQDAAEHFVSAMNRMIWEYSPERQQQRHAAFEAAVASWQAAAVKPSIPDAAHDHQVLAENAVREKNFDKAIDEYEAALEIFPTWPDGQNNLAFLCGETGDYACGIEHAQDYLELVPDATDAQAVKDKIIIWKDKLGGTQDLQAPPPAATPLARKTRR